MITITDFPDVTTPYWEVEDSTGKLEKCKLTYNPSDPTGYDRVYVLRKIVDVHSTMSGCNNMSWKTVGSVFILQ